MAKTYDEKREAFQRMLGGRLPKAVKAVELLGNLSRTSDYAWTNTELQQMTDALDDAVDGVLSAFGIEENGDVDDDRRGSSGAGVGGADGDAGPCGPGSDGPELPADRADRGGDRACDRRDYDGLGSGPVSSFDKAAIKTAFLHLKRGEERKGMKQLRAVILGWSHVAEEEDD